MAKLTLELAIQLLNLVGVLLVSLEILIGKIKLINFFANKISHGSNKYTKKLSRLILLEGIISEKKIIAKIGVFLIILAIFGTIYLIVDG
jgi:hypothetical protein